MSQTEQVVANAPDTATDLPESGDRPRSSADEAEAAREATKRAEDRNRWFLNGTLVAAVGFEAFVLYAIPDPAIRIGLGLVPIVPIMWASSRLGIVDRFARALDERRRARHYFRLRARVSQLLDDVRRMNWVVVDVHRGYRSEESGRLEVERLHARMKEIVETLPEVAGKTGPVEEQP